MEPHLRRSTPPAFPNSTMPPPPSFTPSCMTFPPAPPFVHPPPQPAMNPATPVTNPSVSSLQITFGHPQPPPDPAAPPAPSQTPAPSAQPNPTSGPILHTFSLTIVLTLPTPSTPAHSSAAAADSMNAAAASVTPPHLASLAAFMGTDKPPTPLVPSGNFLPACVSRNPTTGSCVASMPLQCPTVSQSPGSDTTMSFQAIFDAQPSTQQQLLHMLAPTQPPMPASDPAPLHTSVPGFSLLPADGQSDARPLITAHSPDGAPTALMLLDSGSDTCLINSDSITEMRALVSCLVPLPADVMVRMVSANGGTAQALAICLVTVLVTVVAPDMSKHLEPFVFTAFAVPLGKPSAPIIVSRGTMIASGISIDMTDGSPPDFVQQPLLRLRYGAPLPPTMPPVFHMFTPRALALHENLAHAAVARASS